MRTVLAALGIVSSLAVTQTAVARWTPRSFALPIALAAAYGAATVLPHRPLARISLLCAAAAELGSGLAPGVVFLTTAIAPHLFLLVLRHPRPDLPNSLRLVFGALATAAFLLVLQGVAAGNSPFPGRLFPQWFLMRLALPSLLAGIVSSGMARFLRHPSGITVLKALGTTHE